MSTALRLSPSGPIIGNIGAGFALRTEELMSAIVGTLQVPATLAAGPVCSDGFGGAGVLEVSMDEVHPLKKYSAEVWVDVSNASTNIESVVVVELQASTDGGTNWTGFARNQHLMANQGPEFEDATRMVKLNLVPTLGGSLGVQIASPSLKFRVRMGVPTVNGIVEVYSPGTDGYGNPGLKGCFFLKMTEHLAG